MAAYTWNPEKQMFIALGKEFDMSPFIEPCVHQMCSYNSLTEGNMCPLPLKRSSFKRYYSGPS